MSDSGQAAPTAGAGRPAPDPGAVGSILTLTGLTIWAITLIVLCVFGPRLERVFADFGVALPLTTRAGIGASRWLTGRGYAFPGLVIAGPVLLGATFGVFCARRRWGLALLFMLTGIAALTALLVADLLPLVSLTESLQKAN